MAEKWLRCEIAANDKYIEETAGKEIIVWKPFSIKLSKVIGFRIYYQTADPNVVYPDNREMLVLYTDNDSFIIDTEYDELVDLLNENEE